MQKCRNRFKYCQWKLIFCTKPNEFSSFVARWHGFKRCARLVDEFHHFKLENVMRKHKFYAGSSLELLVWESLRFSCFPINYGLQRFKRSVIFCLTESCYFILFSQQSFLSFLHFQCRYSVFIIFVMAK